MSRSNAEQAVFLSTLPAGRVDRQVAFCVVAVSLLLFLALAPFAGRQLPEVWAFIPVYQSAVIISDLMTAAILCIQFNILRSPALLALCCGYVFTALMAAAHMLTFPGLFAPRGLLGAGPQTTAWIYVFWHAGFPLAVIAYALLKRRGGKTVASDRSPRLLVLAGLAGVMAAVAGSVLLTTRWAAILPGLMAGNVSAPALTVVVTVVLLETFCAIVVVWRQRHRSVLDLWIMVVMTVWLFDTALSALLNGQRFSLGYYSGRAYGLLAATFVLLVLLLETGALYAQLARMFKAERIERRREAEERRRLFETSLDLILITDRRGDLLRVSPSSLSTLGYRPAEMVGHSAAEFIFAGDLEATRQEMRLARRGKELRNFATRYMHKEGRIVTLDWSGVWSEPEQRHFFIGRDVTEQKRIERMKDEFVATVSHELRTPVTTIAGPLGLLVGGAAGPLSDPARRLVTMAYQNSERLARLVKDILDIQRIESGAMAIAFERVDIRPLVEQAIEANRPLAEKVGVPVRLDAGATSAAARTDGNALLQVLANLLSNAVKFSPPKEEAVVNIELIGDRIRIAIRDRGPGIPDDFRALIFEKFAQVDATDARQKGGTGLGLSIVRQIMTQLGGSVGHAPAPERGSIFHVEVPRWSPPGMPDSEVRETADAA